MRVLPWDFFASLPLLSVLVPADCVVQGKLRFDAHTPTPKGCRIYSCASCHKFGYERINVVGERVVVALFDRNTFRILFPSYIYNKYRINIDIQI